MKRLELTEEEVHALPNAFQTIGEKKLYPKAFDPSSESEPFFPTDLLDKDGPWVTYSSEQEPSAGGMAHMDSVRHRSVFTLHLRTPDGRDGGVKFLQDFTKSEGQQAVPPGTTLALLRRALVPTRSEKLLVSPFVESLQLIVVTPLEDQRFKFTLDRKEFLTGGAGMKLLGKDDPVDTSSFEAIIIQSRIMSTLPKEPAPPSESLIAGQYRTLREIPSSLESAPSATPSRPEPISSAASARTMHPRQPTCNPTPTRPPPRSSRRRKRARSGSRICASALRKASSGIESQVLPPVTCDQSNCVSRSTNRQDLPKGVLSVSLEAP